MITCIALLRGINVGGHNLLPMKEFRDLLEGLGLRQVKTYIQSGNAVFQADPRRIAGLSKTISEAIAESRGFTPRVLVLPRSRLEGAVAGNPFPEAAAEPKSLHLFFLDAVPQAPDLEQLESIKFPEEKFRLVGEEFYLHCPMGMGKSKLAARVEKSLGVTLTARNWRTVNKLLEMAREASEA